jgi:hypothetical protein
MRGHDRGYLFSSGRLSENLDGRRNAALSAVERISKDQFLATTVDTLVERICAEVTIEKLVIFEEQMSMDQAEAKIEVTGRFDYGFDRGERGFADGHQLSFYLPFSGEPSLWQLQPNTSSSMPPRGQVDSRKSVLTIALSNTSNTDHSWYQSEFQRQLKGIQDYLSWQAPMLAQFERDLPAQVRAAVERRRTQLGQLQNLAAAFNIPLVKKDGMPDFRPIEVQRKIAKPLPRPPATGYKAEPAIASETYEDLLGIIRHAGASFEGTPQTYLPLGEEGLRDNMLSHINVVFEGKATGETFRKYGKTDIRLEEDTRSAFVAECKLWGGQKVLLEALDQLLRYLTWRDCKSALIMFNKDNSGFSGIQDTVAAALKTHSGYLREKPSGRAGEWRFIFQSAEDQGREVTVHVFAFNLHVAPERATKRR